MRYAIRAALAVALLAVAFSQPARADVDVSFGFFYSNLSPHGSWLVSAQYGRVWQPRVYSRDWNPYYDGHWVYTDVGWTWASDYDWGAIPYHYGTWTLDPSFGWVWVPGYVWAPAWVSFCTGPDYIGWAPAPVDFSIGASLEFGVAQAPLFVFVSSHDFLAPRIGAYAYPVARSQVLLRNTRVVNSLAIQNNVVVNRGVDPAFVQRATGRTIRPTPIERVSRVAPFGHVTRTQLQVDPQRMRGGLRAAERVPAETPAPAPRPGDTRASTTREAPAPHSSRNAEARPGTRPNEGGGRAPEQQARRAAPSHSLMRPDQPAPQRAQRVAPDKRSSPTPQRAQHVAPDQRPSRAPQKTEHVAPPKTERPAPQQRTHAGRAPQHGSGPQEHKEEKPGRGDA